MKMIASSREEIASLPVRGGRGGRADRRHLGGQDAVVTRCGAFRSMMLNFWATLQRQAAR